MTVATRPLTYTRYEDGHPATTSRQVVREALITLFVNGQEWVTFLCTPVDLNQLAIGFLYSEGVISGLEDIGVLRVCDEAEDESAKEEVHVQLLRPVEPPDRRVLTSGCGGGTTFVDLAAAGQPVCSSRQISAAQVAALMRQLNERAEVHRVAGGVHTSALGEGNELLMVVEDVGRHNTLDKILGRCLLLGLDTADHILLTTGRVSAEMLHKASRMGVPIVISRTSPTDLAVELARAWKITLIGYARGTSFNVYAGEWRIE